VILEFSETFNRNSRRKETFAQIFLISSSVASILVDNQATVITKQEAGLPNTHTDTQTHTEKQMFIFSVDSKAASKKLCLTCSIKSQRYFAQIGNLLPFSSSGSSNRINSRKF